MFYSIAKVALMHLGTIYLPGILTDTSISAVVELFDESALALTLHLLCLFFAWKCIGGTAL